MSKKMMHIGLEKGQIGKYVFLPGSPERTERIAAYFENPREIAYNREYRTFVGELNGVPVAVTSTGIGGPSTAIAVEELYQCGAHTMMRVGTCASTSPKVCKGDVVIPSGAVRMEGVSKHYVPIEFPAVPDFQMVKAIEQAAKNLDLPYNIGITITKASFYTQNEPMSKPVGSELVYRWQAYEKGGATNTSMECSVLFTVGSSLDIRTACVMASATDYKDYGEKGKGKTVPINVEDRAIRTAIEAMKIIIAGDQEQG